MAMTIDEVGAFLDADAIKYTLHEKASGNDIGFWSETYFYRDCDDGGKHIFFMVALENEGKILNIMAPRVYLWLDGPDKSAFLRTLLAVMKEAKLVFFDYNEENHDVLARITIPLEDGTVTLRQFRECLGTLMFVLDRYHPVIEHARRTGQVDFTRESSPEYVEDWLARTAADTGKPPKDLMREFLRFLHRQSELHAPLVDHRMDSDSPTPAVPKDPASNDLAPNDRILLDD